MSCILGFLLLYNQTMTVYQRRRIFLLAFAALFVISASKRKVIADYHCSWRRLVADVFGITIVGRHEIPLNCCRCEGLLDHATTFIRTVGDWRMASRKRWSTLRASTSSLTSFPWNSPSQRNHTIGWTSQFRVNGERSLTLCCLRISISRRQTVSFSPLDLHSGLLSRGSLLAVYCFPTSALLVSRSISFRRMVVFLIFVSPYARCTVKSDIFGNDSFKQIERHSVGSAAVKKSRSRLKIIQVSSLSDSIHDGPAFTRLSWSPSILD